MTKKIVEQVIATMIAGTALLLLNGCADSYSGYQSDGGRAYYDQYVDRPGYYDFGRPVIFVPEDNTGLTKPQ